MPLTEFRDFVVELQKMYCIKNENYFDELAAFLADNDWFGVTVQWKDKNMYVNPTEFADIMPAIKRHFDMAFLSEDKQRERLEEMLAEKDNNTFEKLKKFYETFDIPDDTRLQLNEFIFRYLKVDVCFVTDAGLKELVDVVCEDIPKYVGDAFTMFLAWVKEHYSVCYVNDYMLTKRISREDENEAYEQEDYLQLLYYLYCPSYIDDRHMYQKAAQSKNYADTWLYLALHFICALRDTDLVRIPHPRLEREPEDILKDIKRGTFTDKEAVKVIYSIIYPLRNSPLKPNKTKRYSSVPYIKFDVPESCEVHIGMLFAIAEAHRIIAGVSDNEPLIRVIKSYREISKNMGDEIGMLFIESDFKARRMNKAYMQSIFELTDTVSQNGDEFSTKGYMMAAFARSHKGSFGEFAHTTYRYLKDANMSGLTPEYVAKELFERGVLSFIPSMLLKMITGGGYNRLTVQNQTRLIKELGMSPGEIETAVKVSDSAFRKSAETAADIYRNTDRETVINVLHRMGNGEAVSKMRECGCLYSAFGKLCPYDDNHNCMNCDYEISSKSTIFLMASEFNRLNGLYKSAESLNEKEKCESMIVNIVMPAMNEILTCAGETYGSEAAQMLGEIIKESTAGED
ncbi:hypothetical protein GKD71_01675 [[Eubacterium] rectale]|jgi:hypothetical protein|uniref:Uncharacterized protein n=1 Tax=Agathobacter rectalis TaxID=39491 RepID=A0A7X2JI08_9FIRM|nr:hypothetical protein [Agathobacter rectalis]MSC53532.1 hypothetical protein [Agathobacter rectalis]MSC87023.1 hypothetical protein [Agathobacter rectalis]MSD09160.1 hypothetical protein [Agathobacter rectalis]MSD17894.1 hypothetical protein [Agathobacter rectalis]MSD21492.1 hypothetical protein [Agathobacter rectalis]